MLPRRSKKYGVGKEVYGAVYLHRDYERLIGSVISATRTRLPADFEYQVVKYDRVKRAVSFIQCAEFDSSPEPTVGDIFTVDEEGGVRRRRQPRNPEIYHHKWLFVADDYKSFDVEASRQRSISWMKLDGIDRRRIGRRNYWYEIVVPRLDDTCSSDSRV